MKDSTVKSIAIGSAVGFLLMSSILLLRIRMPLIVYTIWPLRILNVWARGSGTVFLLTVRTLAFALNVGLYSLIGFAVGKYIEGPAQEPKEKA